MFASQIINPHVLQQFILLNEYILRIKFPEARITSKRGRPRIGLRWVLVAICVFARNEQITWKKLPEKLSNCNFLIENGYLSKIPSKSTFHRVWSGVSKANLNSWIRKIGYELSKSNVEDLVVDSSGFETKIGSIWRIVKWDRRLLSKLSKLFLKIHIAVALPSRAITSIFVSESAMHDAKAFGPLWLRMSKRLIPKIKRTHLDKAYWSENIIGLLDQEGIQAVVPCKRNSIDHGYEDPMDQLVRMQRKMPGLYKKNYKTSLRAEVEHVIGNTKQSPPVLLDRRMHNKLKTLLCAFVWYNHTIRVKGVKNV